MNQSEQWAEQDRPSRHTLTCEPEELRTESRTQRRPAGRWRTRTRTPEEQEARALTTAAFRSVVMTSWCRMFCVSSGPSTLLFWSRVRFLNVSVGSGSIWKRLKKWKLHFCFTVAAARVGVGSEQTWLCVWTFCLLSAILSSRLPSAVNRNFLQVQTSSVIFVRDLSPDNQLLFWSSTFWHHFQPFADFLFVV